MNIYTKTLNVKGSRNGSTAAQVAAVMKVLVTDFIYPRDLVTVYLNCDGVGTSSLDVDLQINPETSTAIWYTAQAFTQVLTTPSQQILVPTAIGYSMRALPTLGGTHNFGVRCTLPASGYIVSDSA